MRPPSGGVPSEINTRLDVGGPACGNRRVETVRQATPVDAPGGSYADPGSIPGAST